MHFQYEKYSDFTEKEFLCDPFFQEWVIDPDEEKDDFWNGFLSSYPDKREALERARKLLANLSFREHFPEDEVVQAALAKHLQALEDVEQAKVIPIHQPAWRWRNVLKVAAVFGGVLLMVSVLLLLNNREKKVAVQTAYGKLQTLLLPDSSRVILNAASKIEYSKNWKEDKKREVWLEGEAYFDVRHLNRDTGRVTPYEQFVVHTKNVDVEVLGTSFDIRERRGKTEVVLETGKIKLTFTDRAHTSILMAPGDLVAYDPDKNRPIRTTTNPENYTAWKENKLLLNNPTVNEIIQYLEDNYGKKIILGDQQLRTRTVEGPILLNNLDDALFILSINYNTEVIKKGDTIILRPR